MNEEELYSLIIKGIKLTTTRQPDTSIINASAIYNCCPRGFILSKEYGLLLHDNNKNLTDSDKVTFKLGLLCEDMIREALIDKLIDNSEMVFKLGEFKLVGHRDITIQHKGKKYIIEVKSIDKDEYDKLKKYPIYKHEFQLKTYLYLAKKNKLGISGGFLIYISKGKRQPPIKIYKVTCGKSFTREMDAFVEAIKNNKKEVKLCETKDHALVIKCPALYLCFKEGEYVKSKQERCNNGIT